VPSLFEVQRSFGWVACWSGFIVAFPALQSNLLLHLFGIPFERSIKHHRMMGRWFWIFQTIHFILALTSFDLMTLISNFDAPVKPVFVSYGFGFLTWVISTIVALTSLNVVRRKCWEVFYYTHYILTKMVYLFGKLKFVFFAP
jgi:DMSO/TMAO reductase YedYZ heme-binding membrane subunit